MPTHNLKIIILCDEVVLAARRCVTVDISEEERDKLANAAAERAREALAAPDKPLEHRHD